MMTQSSFELLFQFSIQMQKAISVYFDHPAFKDGKKFYEDIVNKRILESNKRFNPNASLMRFDASTIRHTGAGHNFSITDAPRFSLFGSVRNRPTGSTIAGVLGGMQRKGAGVGAPRHHQPIDFNSFRGAPPPKTDRRDVFPETSPRKDEMFSSLPRQNKRNFERRDDDFDEESFNDTDEEIIGKKFEIKDSAGKSPKKAKIQGSEDSETMYSPSGRRKPKESARPRPEPVKEEEYYEPMRRLEQDLITEQPQRVRGERLVEPISSQPRVGPSRLHRGGNAALRKNVRNLTFIS